MFRTALAIMSLAILTAAQSQSPIVIIQTPYTEVWILLAFMAGILTAILALNYVHHGGYPVQYALDLGPVKKEVESSPVKKEVETAQPKHRYTVMQVPPKVGNDELLRMNLLMAQVHLANRNVDVNCNTMDLDGALAQEVRNLIERFYPFCVRGVEAEALLNYNRMGKNLEYMAMRVANGTDHRVTWKVYERLVGLMKTDPIWSEHVKQ